MACIENYSSEKNFLTINVIDFLFILLRCLLNVQYTSKEQNLSSTSELVRMFQFYNIGLSLVAQPML
jgi:hypothetical protein